MKSSGTCKHCIEAENAKILPKNVTVIGEDVVIGTSVGRGFDETTYSFAQCNECGSIWVQYNDSGAGGHGRFQKRLTKGLF